MAKSNLKRFRGDLTEELFADAVPEKPPIGGVEGSEDSDSDDESSGS